jgi:2-polyprenyl-6-methoxyphenol hydroxylase-like FAD-dependent oxidoreductase
VTNSLAEYLRLIGLCRAVAAMLDVAIIGAGPGGAAAANSIRRAAPQLKVKVFERAAQLRRVGFTFGMAASCLSSPAARTHLSTCRDDG